MRRELTKSSLKTGGRSHRAHAGGHTLQVTAPFAVAIPVFFWFVFTVVGGAEVAVDSQGCKYYKKNSQPNLFTSTTPFVILQSTILLLNMFLPGYVRPSKASRIKNFFISTFLNTVTREQ